VVHLVVSITASCIWSGLSYISSPSEQLASMFYVEIKLLYVICHCIFLLEGWRGGGRSTFHLVVVDTCVTLLLGVQTSYTRFFAFDFQSIARIPLAVDAWVETTTFLYLTLSRREATALVRWIFISIWMGMFI
jgi:hypothetical protein